MEELRRSKLVPNCAVGLPILLVDHDTTSLMCLASMLEQYLYNVTTTELTSAAMSMINERKERFKLVMADINMDDINSLSFLDMLVKKAIPVILMSSQKSENVAEKAIAHGACLHLVKPISLNDLKYLWQHVYRNDMDSMKKTFSFGNESPAININETTTESESTAATNSHFHAIDRTISDSERKKKKKKVIEKYAGIVEANCIEHMVAIEDLKHGGSSSKTKRSYDDEQENRNDKTSKSYSDPTDPGKKNNQSSSSRGSKTRLVWNQKLHQKFTAALTALCDKNARPKLILKMMNEPNLTHRQVASHLQKYKAHVKRISTAGSTNLSSVMNASRSINAKPEFFNMLQKNESVLSPLGHKSSNFSIGAADTHRFANLPQDSNASMISSLYQNQLSPSVPQGIHQKLHVTLDSTDSVITSNETKNFPSMRPCIPESTSISLNQSQVFVSADEHTTMPNADQSLADIIGQNPEVDAPTFSENQKQQSPEFVDLLEVLKEESDECRGSGFEPHPGEVDQYCEWLKEAMFGNNEQS
ncbi:hypothetical protein DITRI_Ditri12bG0080400 [Diplodiscus trichospermus]